MHITFRLRNTSLKKALAFASAFFWLPLLDLNSAYFEPYGSRHELLRNSTLFLVPPVASLGAGWRGQGQEGKEAKKKESEWTPFGLGS